MAVFLISHVAADIIVQPGYEQQHVATQPPETLRHSVQQDNQRDEQQDRQQREEYVDPGYHLELHPVYGNSYHIPSYAVLPMYRQPGTIPSMSKAAYKRLLSSMGEGAEVPAIVPPQYYQYLPQVSTSDHNFPLFSNRPDIFLRQYTVDAKGPTARSSMVQDRGMNMMKMMWPRSRP